MQNAASGIPAGALEGALVILPRPAGLPALARLRSPVWTALLPGSIIVGTFGLIALPRSATTTLVAAAITTPLLALLALAWVVRARALVLPVAVVAGALAVSATGALGDVGASVVTALACLTIGATLQTLIPRRWLLPGVLAMAVADIALLASGFGYHQTALLAAAAGNFHGPHFTGARVGGTTIGYPDLFLAGLLGTSLAGSRVQRLGAVLLALLVVAYDSLLSPGVLLPGTVPIAAALIVVLALQHLVALQRRRRAVSASAPLPAAPPHASASSSAGRLPTARRAESASCPGRSTPGGGRRSGPASRRCGPPSRPGR